jgi:polyisoprenyl-teichoic acid--peptidoglycan teichoic acid transferase
MIRKTLLLVAMVLAGMALVPGLFVRAQEAAAAPWDGQSRFTVLVLGLDRRPSEPESLEYRTDAIFLASIDPIQRRIGLLHIPRDTYVDMPNGAGLVPVNTLLLRASGDEVALDTMRRAITHNFAMPIDAVVSFDFEVFTTLVDAVGGLPLDVPAPIYDDFYPDMTGGYDPFTLAAGPQVLDGATALKYARTRHGDDDFRRGQRQMEVILALAARLRDDGVLATLIGQIPNLLADLDGHFSATLPPEQVILVGLVMLDMPADGVTVGQIDEDSTYRQRVDGANVRVLDHGALPALLRGIFGDDYWR